MNGSPNWAWLLAALLGACQQEPVDADPARVVEAFVDRMRGVHGDPSRGRRALELIWSKGRENLEERARRASAASGRPVGPEEMLAPSRFSLAFEPIDYSAEVKGRWSRVTVTGSNPKTEIVDVHCVKEGERWRVAFDLPELPPIQWRQ